MLSAIRYIHLYNHNVLRARHYNGTAPPTMSIINEKTEEGLAQPALVKTLQDETTHTVVDIAARAHIEAVEYTEAESRAVLRKIDWHLMPLLVWICKSEPFASC